MSGWPCLRCRWQNELTASQCVQCMAPRDGVSNPNPFGQAGAEKQPVPSYDAATQQQQQQQQSPQSQHHTITMSPSGVSGNTDSFPHVMSAPVQPNPMATHVFDPTLPAGWEPRTDEWGRAYYVNHATQTSHWERPAQQPPSLFRRMSTNMFAAPPNYANAVAHAPHYGGDININQLPPAQPNQPMYGGAGGVPLQPIAENPGQPQQQPQQPQQQGDVVLPQQYAEPVVLDQFANVIPEHIRLKSVDIEDEKNKADSMCYHCHSTVTINPCLTLFSIIVWALVALAIALSVSSGRPVTWAVAIGGAAYAAWVFVVMCPSGGCPLTWFCCFVRSSCVVTDPVVESIQLEAKPNSDDAAAYIRLVSNAQPIMRLNVVCSHTRTTGHGKNRRTRTIVTYRGSMDVPIQAYREMGPSPAMFAAAVDATTSSYQAVSYGYEYAMPDENALSAWKSWYYNANRHRDRNTSVSHTYLAVPDARAVDLILRDKSCKYYCANACVNRCSFFLCGYATLYLPFICLWKLWVRPIRYVSTKYVVLQDAPAF